jgi:hypothetical protein
LNRTFVAVILYVCLVVLAGVLIVDHVTATRDVSWTSEVEAYIADATWLPETDFHPIMDWAFFFYENGTENYFDLESRNELKQSINNIMNKIDRRIIYSISEDTLEQILTNDKVLEVYHRFPTKSWGKPNDFGSKISYDRIYFVLEENQKISINTTLTGTIIVREANPDSYNYSVWQISKSTIW